MSDSEVVEQALVDLFGTHDSSDVELDSIVQERNNCLRRGRTGCGANRDLDPEGA